jgi:kinesin family protein 18/19
MIANISPAMIHFEETHNTLKYANRAKQIRIAVEQNVVNVDYHIGQYVELIESLKKEVDTLKRQGQFPV